jgi:hypothetical protein
LTSRSTARNAFSTRRELEQVDLFLQRVQGIVADHMSCAEIGERVSLSFDRVLLKGRKCARSLGATYVRPANVIMRSIRDTLRSGYNATLTHFSIEHRAHRLRELPGERLVDGVLTNQTVSATRSYTFEGEYDRAMNSR